ncbi:putative rRNA-processing protein EBP2 [Phytophthora pseudosyringae]|uniref:Putative rRNA-processing protein EBP2 n=1 Tax=Phytophthora pseudosyringae TaxID=221518 RepID=A0A8T1WD12_9STRA|nr:putative rRNA-processing protein EBP2 [Phytophthora pseudosyringae]
MARKSSGARKGRAVSALVRAEDAAEEEILETPALSSVVAAASDVESEDEDAAAEAEAEIERRLVAEAQAEAESAKRESKGVCNTEALLALVKDWDAAKPLAWVETLDTCAAPLELESVHDDLKREVAFYNNTLAMVRMAKDRLKRDGVAYKRPDDYFAEMLKSDAHMAKVKDKLIYEQKKITAVEERKKSQAHRKVAKEVQAEKIKERNQQKKDTLEAVKQWKKRKGNDKRGGLKDDDDNELDSIVSGKRKHAGGDRDGASKKLRANKAREAKDAKFGFGGKRRHAKSNTKQSTNDLSGFPGARKGQMKKSQAAPKGGKRAGKDQRTNQRNKSRR